MNTAKYFQKGFSPIVIVIVLAVIGLGAFFIYNSSSPKSSQNNSQTDQGTVTNKFNKYEDNRFIVYYPKSLTSKSNVLDTVIFRDDPTAKYDNLMLVGEIFEASMLPYKAGLEEDVLNSDNDCKQIKQSFPAKYNTMELVESKYIEYKTYKGCLNTYKTDTKYNYIYYIIYEKPVADVKTSIFKVSANVDSTNTTLSEDMREAVSMFTPKSQ